MVEGTKSSMWAQKRNTQTKSSMWAQKRNTQSDQGIREGFCGDFKYEQQLA